MSQNSSRQLQAVLAAFFLTISWWMEFSQTYLARGVDPFMNYPHLNILTNDISYDNITLYDILLGDTGVS
jgi:hypothetical protein